MTDFDTIERCTNAFREGKVVIVVDDVDRENEGDFIMAAEKATPEAVNFITKYGRGLMCVPLTEERAKRLGLDLMVRDNTAIHQTRFTVSVDAAKGISTGISAYDRAKTIAAMVDARTRPEDLARPGHVFPILAIEGGVLRRAGHTEAAVDLARMAGLKPVGVLCEIMDDDGTMARLPRLRRMAKKFDLPLVTIGDIISYRLRHEQIVRKVSEVQFPTTNGDFRLHLYENVLSGEVHIALVRGKIEPNVPTLVRVHSECLTGDVLDSLRCDCGQQLSQALRAIGREDTGVLLYMRQEGRGIGLKNKILAYELQDSGKDTVEANEELGLRADLRDYGRGAQILADLGVGKMRLLTNNPKKVIGLDAYGLEIVERVPIEIPPTAQNRRYLESKRDKLGHLILES